MDSMYSVSVKIENTNDASKEYGRQRSFSVKFRTKRNPLEAMQILCGKLEKMIPSDYSIRSFPSVRPIETQILEI